MNTLEAHSKHDAVIRILQHVPAPQPETLPLANARSRVLLETVYADREHPAINRATMDGFALRSSEHAPGRGFPLSGKIAAGEAPPAHVAPGTCVAIATGAAVPDDLDAVVEHELSDRGDPVHFTIEHIVSGRNIHPRGIDRAAGDVVLNAASVIGPAEIGVAASMGHARLTLARKPNVIVISTGEELLDIALSPEPHQLRDSNQLMIASAVEALGGEVMEIHRVPDTLEATIDILQSTAPRCDLLITIGGVSAGEHDHVPAAWDHLAATPILSRVAIQPGRPTRCWRCGPTLCLALPGNPVSALVCLHLFARPWLRAMLGLDPLGDWEEATLHEEITPNPHRTQYRPCMLRPTLRIPAWHGSGDLPHLASTHGLIELPAQEPPLGEGTTCATLKWEYLSCT